MFPASKSSLSACLLAMLLLAGLAACAGPRPVAQVGDVYVTEVTDEGSRVAFTVQLRNPGEVSLPVEEATYTVRLDDQTFTFTERPPLTMPAGGAQTILFPAAFEVPGQPLSGRAYQVQGTVRYRPPGQIREALTDAGLPLPAVRFRQAGRLEAAAPSNRSLP